jgi:membrane fusion protein (multidrug efflux system)
MNSGSFTPALGILVLPLVLAACSGGGTQAQGNPGGRGRPGGPTPVAVVTVAPRDLARTITVTGPVEPIRTVSVSARTAGTLLTVKVEEGDRVTAGQLLAELDAREITAQLEHAKAVLANAENSYKRAQDLHGDDLIAESELDAARSSHDMAQADVELWSTRLAFCRITSPVNGVVTRKLVEEGNSVSSGDELFTIADDTVLVVRVQVSELDVVHLKPGLSVSLRLDAYPGREIGGHVRRIFPAADPASRLVPVEVQLDPRPPGVVARPGFLARVEFALDRRDGVLAVPASAIGTSAAGSYVYVVQADTLVRRSVETGRTAAGWIEVTQGLAPGVTVVSSGQVNLRQGAPVRITSGSGAPVDSEAVGGEAPQSGSAAGDAGR